MQAAARRAKADVEGALGLAETGDGEWLAPVLGVSAARHDGIDALAGEIDRHRGLAGENRRRRARSAPGRRTIGCVKWCANSLACAGLHRPVVK